MAMGWRGTIRWWKVILTIVFVGCAMAWLLSNKTSYITTAAAQHEVSCLRTLPAEQRSRLPNYQFVAFKNTLGVVACYAENDIVCSEMRKHGEFEPDVLLLVTTAADRLRDLVEGAMHVLSTRLGVNCARVKDLQAKDVLYVDIGGNVGVFAMTMINRGFNTMIFEALPANAALLTLTLCVNKAIQVQNRGFSTSALLTHVALGPQGASSTCVIQSGSDNVGDAQISCDNAVVSNARRLLSAQPSVLSGSDKTTLGMLRGFVNLTSLDDILFGRGDLTAFVNGAARRCLGSHAPAIDANTTDPSIPRQLGEGQGYFVHRAKPFDVASASVAELLQLVSNSQVVVKMDVEGFEHMIVQGAHNFLSNRVTRPKIIVAEIWKSRDVGDFCTRMIRRYGYVAYSLQRNEWMRFVEDAIAFHQRMNFEVGTIVFVASGFEHLIYH